MPLPPGRGHCSVEGCDRDIFTRRGWCEMHYQRWRVHGDPAYENPKVQAFCSEEQCELPVRSKGLCSSCYHRALYSERRARQGKPPPAPIERPCTVCGSTFRRRRRQVYCSPECARAARQAYYLLRDYGLTLDDYSALLERQGRVCAICQRPDDSAKAILHVDHCHDTGRVRGLLCHRCNVGVGHFLNDPALLIRAASYLET